MGFFEYFWGTPVAHDIAKRKTGGRTTTKRIAIFLVITFAALGLLHIYWAFGGRSAIAAVVPSVAGRPVFRPSFSSTLLVAGALFAAAVVISGAIGWLGNRVPASVFRLLTFAISLVFLLRAIGDFRYVGFFKAGSHSTFAFWDRWLYSPLCLLIALSAFVVARRTSEGHNDL